jgi:hypothetical protein
VLDLLAPPALPAYRALLLPQIEPEARSEEDAGSTALTLLFFDI